MAITLSQLARELGVSTMTVSRALRGVGRIGEETRERIVNAARRHGYRPHGLARAMRSGRSGCVALCVADGEAGSAGTGAMPSQLAIGIDRALTQRGMYLAVARVPGGDKPTDDAFVPRLLGEWVADGMIFHAARGVPCSVSEQLRQRRVPCVWINARQPHDCVDCDDFDAARRATQRLIQLGHRRIVYANHFESRNSDGPAAPAGARERYAGYESILKETGLPRRRVYRHPLVSFVEMWRAILAEPANQRPTAVLCFSRYTAHPILQAAGQMSREIPKDLSLVSFDDEPASEFEFPLSTMVLPERQMGHKAVEMLCAKIDSPDAAQPIEAVKILAEWFEGGTMAGAPRELGA